MPAPYVQWSIQCGDRFSRNFCCSLIVVKKFNSYISPKWKNCSRLWIIHCAHTIVMYPNPTVTIWIIRHKAGNQVIATNHNSVFQQNFNSRELTNRNSIVSTFLSWLGRFPFVCLGCSAYNPEGLTLLIDPSLVLLNFLTDWISLRSTLLAYLSMKYGW